MAKLSDMIAKAIKADVKGGIVAAAANVETKAPKASGVVGAIDYASKEQSRLAEVGFIAKTLRGGVLAEADKMDLKARGKAVGTTGNFADLIPAGFTGTLIEDIKEELTVAKLFAMKTIKGGSAYDLVALYGITAYLTDEAAEGTESGEGYLGFVATTNNVLAVVRKSYALVEDSLIDLASEVRAGIVQAIAEAIEETVINGDIAGTMDDGTASNSAIKVSNGLRKTGLGKATVDFGGSALTEDAWLEKFSDMQLAGGKYLDQRAVARGDVALVIDQHTYAKIRNFDGFKTINVAGRVATLFGGKVEAIFGIPLVVSSNLPAVDANGVVSATASDNTLSTCVMVNVSTCQLSVTGNVISENDKNITKQVYIYTGSLRYGFSSKYDSAQSTPNTISAAYKNVVAGINVPR